MGNWQRFSGWRLDARGRLTRLMLLHRIAVESELEGLWTRADFFWGEFRRKLNPVALMNDLSQTFPGELGSSELATALSVQTFCLHLFNEVFVDAQCAFFNGYSERDQNPKPDWRQFDHLDHLSALLDVLEVDENFKLQLLGEATERRVQTCSSAGKWDDAKRHAADLLKRFPKSLQYQEMLASLEFARATVNLKQVESEQANRTDAAVLRPPIEALERMCIQFPSTARPYELAGRLHRIRAVKLANGGKLADALLAIEKAAAYDPSIDTLDEDRAKVGSMMKDLQQRMNELLRTIASRPNATLNYEGLQLQRDAMAGFAPSLDYRKSKEAEEITAKSQSAQLRTIWRRIGLAEPDEDVWDAQVNHLFEAMNAAMAQQPKNPASLDLVWNSIAEHDPRVAALDGVLITSFLKQRFFSQSDSPPRTPTDSPQLPVTDAPTSSGIPFGFWAFSRRDIRLKIQCVLACTLLLLVGILAIKNTIKVRQRETAWQQIEEANNRGDDFAVVKGSEVFFDSSPPKSDQRIHQVEAMYKSALLRWFSCLPGEPDSEALVHIRRFRSLFGAGG